MNGVTTSFKSNFLRGGGNLDFRVRFAMAKSPRKRKAMDRIAQPKPMRTTRRFTIIGRTTPPILDPEVMIPKAMARCRRNQVPTAPIADVVIRDCGGRKLCERRLTGVEEERASHCTTNTLR